MQKAEERAWEAYPSESHWFNEDRAAFIKGYQQAEKDMAEAMKQNHIEWI